MILSVNLGNIAIIIIQTIAMTFMIMTVMDSKIVQTITAKTLIIVNA